MVKQVGRLIFVMMLTVVACGAKRSDAWKTVYDRKAAAEAPILETAQKIANDESTKINGYDGVSEDTMRHFVLGFAKDIGISNNETIVDFGCGSGNFLKILDDHYDGLELAGYDMCAGLIHVAKEILPQATLGVQDVTKLEISDEIKGSADHAICFGVFMYLDSEDDVVKAMSDMLTAVKPGGKMFIGEIDDLAKKKLATAVREQTHGSRQKYSDSNELDHLYLSREFFEQFASDNHLAYRFVEWGDTEEVKTAYPNSQYRFHVLFEKLDGRAVVSEAT